MLNINGKPDPSYRYKMTPISATINGKGNGVYTTILNLNEVCKDINQPPIVILKFLSLNFGSMCNEEKGTITGGYKNEEIQKALIENISMAFSLPEDEAISEALSSMGFNRATEKARTIVGAEIEKLFNENKIKLVDNRIVIN